jgi:hypothetical protein
MVDVELEIVKLFDRNVMERNGVVAYALDALYITAQMYKSVKGTLRILRPETTETRERKLSCRREVNCLLENTSLLTHSKDHDVANT